MALARVGRFEIERRLGSGSFATVWLARDEDLDALVAIKVLADNWSYNEDARRRFLEEARALRRLDNDRIVRVYEVGRLDDDRPYMVMEHADRGTLEDRMRLSRTLGRPFSVREALELSIEIAECLASVHESRIVHRDLKPSNVLYRSVSAEAQEAHRRLGRPVTRERTLLGDFGIARRLEGMLGHTLVLGSPHYMAPEQADPGMAGSADGRSDLYSAAVVLFELLAGRLPYRFESIGDLQRLGRDAVVPSVDRIRPEVPADLAEVIARGLTRDPRERLDSAWAWRDALRAALAEAPREIAVVAVPGRVDSAALASGGHAAAVATASGAAGSPGTTVPAPTRTGTHLLPDGGPTARPPVRPDQPIHMAHAPVVASGASAPVGDAPGPPPKAEVGGPPVRLRIPALGVIAASLIGLVGVLLPWRADARGTAFGQGSAVAATAVVLFVCGLRMWRTERRWVAILAAGLSLGIGAAGVLFAPVTMLTVRGNGTGLAAIVLAATVAFGSGYLALLRLGRDPRLWVKSRPARSG